MKHPLVWLSALLFTTLGSLPAANEPDRIAELTPLTPLVLDLASPTTAIVSPAGAAYETIAKQLAAELERSTGHRPAIRPDTTAAADLGPGPILTLGNLMDSQLGRRLYLDAYDFTDAAWPSHGGHVLRTVRDPLGTGAHVLVIGGSDVEGVAGAGAELVDFVRTHGARLGYLNRVKLGDLAPTIRSYTEPLLAEGVAKWQRVGGSGSWDHQTAITRAAAGYLRTGDERYLAGFRSELRYWLNHDVFHPGTEAKTMLHGHLNMLVMAWDLVADHPSIPPEERRRTDADLLATFRTPEGPDRIASESQRRAVRSNHSTRTGLDAYFGGRYFLRRYGVADGRRWLGIADGMFAPMLESAKPGEDSWGHQWACSLFNTVVYGLAAGKEEFLHFPALRQAADRALIAHSHAQAPMVYLAACAVATGDTGYLSAFPEGDLLRRGAAMIGQGDEYLRSFETGRPVVPRRDLLAVAVAPVAPLWYDTYEGGPKGDGFFVINQPREACFDKISIREGWGASDFYLLLDGISGGVHAYQDANCIVRFSEQGVTWLISRAGATTSGSVRGENGVFTAIESAGTGNVHRYARRLYSGTAGEAGADSVPLWMAVGAALEGLGELDWQRHILRRRGRWTLVIDVAIPRHNGEALIERYWHSGSHVQALPDGMAGLMSPRAFHLQTVGAPIDGMRGTNDRVESLRAPASEGQPVAMASLLHVNRTPDQRDVTLRRVGEGWRVDDAGDIFFVMLSMSRPEGMAIVGKSATEVIGGRPAQIVGFQKLQEAGETPAAPSFLPKTAQTTLPWREYKAGSGKVSAVARAPGGRIAAGDCQGEVRIFGPDAKITSARVPSEVVSLHFLGDDLLVGEDRGAISRFAPDGTRRWERVLPYVSLPWANWSEGRSRIREITAGDLSGKGRTGVLLSNADRRVYALDEAGQELWRTPIEWGVYTAMAIGRYEGKPALVGGTSRPAIHGWCVILGDGGKVLGNYTRADLTNWSNPCQFRDLRVADLDGDGQAEVVAAIDADCRQVVAYRADGRILWDADVGGAAEAVAVRPAEGGRAAMVYCVSSSGYVCGLDGPTGKRGFATFLGQRSTFVAALGGGNVLAAGPAGEVFLIGADGRLVGKQGLGSEITAFLRPGDHRNGNGVVLGTSDGRVRVLSE